MVPKKSKQFEYRECKYSFELLAEIDDLTVETSYEFPDHRPVHKDYNGAHLIGEPIPSEYTSNSFMQPHFASPGTSVSKFKDVDGFLIDCHKKATSRIDAIIELTDKMDLDFHVLAARVSDSSDTQ